MTLAEILWEDFDQVLESITPEYFIPEKKRTTKITS